ncbi:uncharacterized protein EURHEDRAFT_450195 [Aspergillus ruber CBS 135680]|uniref:HAT C-terminal dimerisation domain-containing protein n=1 Tax=Aspergillus ruber (strain CBS 135680) TaxID=1388766 RepID=A0A017SLW3_ASPRC|nr:uncharacterized protein EURHEDRAFT_450195 [Aspergillus ruber CBS 135680]EYE97599.1 hypothetical protein EURHEDRAFT_450195 [Aspergillus ruber CBS 135680]
MEVNTSIQQLQRKKVSWKKTMLDTLEAARSKLSDYYGNTDNKLHGDIFAISTIMAPSNKLQFFSTKGWEDDTIDYSGLVYTPPRLFWKVHELEFPALSSLARDILSIPASGAGVERLFNSARDICHYRRGNLKPDTIKDLMMYTCTSKFVIKQEELDLIKEYLSAGEITGIEEEKALTQPQEDLEPISNNEEDDILYNSQPAAPSERALGKRRRSISSEPRVECHLGWGGVGFGRQCPPQRGP